ncbi:unnamed protein product [Polarella glacialis]|uniref:Uncharacterized protein n=1 Tax=Polarella glacialis TaxID=89957 RepID=A0A813D0F0_POLGL|nr:unnamed protein product [Polarella glacialis]CAE8681579.1 unnamed protein product [Polarella glacialis]|mmetsp:Transcript_16273/g.26021  ORF Transcript_16273/g.26021 Transcript_16273/m.26021 type:complete len:269 (-) Transcript_16273:88-894(-)
MPQPSMSFASQQGAGYGGYGQATMHPPASTSHRQGKAYSAESLYSPAGTQFVDSRLLQSEEVGILQPRYGPLTEIAAPDRPLVSHSAAERQPDHLLQDTHLPAAHQMYQYGERRVTFGPVPVQQANNGVIIIREIQGPPPRIGMPIVHNDDGIQNPSWRKIGAMLQTADSTNSNPLAAELHEHADYSGAVDLKGSHLMAQHEARPSQRWLPDFSALNRLRSGDDGIHNTAQKVKYVLQSEILDEHRIKEFFSRPEAVSYEGSRNVGDD